LRNRRGLNRIGMLAIAMIIALGAVGVTYGAWVDEITITGYLSTSDINTTLTCGTCSPDSGTTYIECTPVTNPTKLTMTVVNAQFDATNNTNYYCDFIVSNAVNSFSVEVASLSISGSYTGVTADIEDLTVGTVIAPGTSATGKVHIYLTDAGQLNQTLPFTLTVIVH